MLNGCDHLVERVKGNQFFFLALPIHQFFLKPFQIHAAAVNIGITDAIIQGCSLTASRRVLLRRSGCRLRVVVANTEAVPATSPQMPSCECAAGKETRTYRRSRQLPVSAWITHFSAISAITVPMIMRSHNAR